MHLWTVHDIHSCPHTHTHRPLPIGFPTEVSIAWQYRRVICFRMSYAFTSSIFFSLCLWLCKISRFLVSNFGERKTHKATYQEGIAVYIEPTCSAKLSLMPKKVGQHKNLLTKYFDGFCEMMSSAYQTSDLQVMWLSNSCTYK